MNDIAIEPLVGKLHKRLGDIVRTLAYVIREHQHINDRRELIDRAAYLSRCRLLDTLADSYKGEISQIDQALERARTGQYGLCLGCHEPIACERLELAPDAAFCATCEEFRDVLVAR